MNNYQCALISSYNYLIDQMINTLGFTFKRENNMIGLSPIKSNDITLDQEARIRNQLNELNFQSYNTIVIIVKFDRTDLMRREIQSYKLPLQKYLKNIVILVSGFKDSLQNIKDYQSIINLFMELNLYGIVTSDKLKMQDELSDLVQKMTLVRIELSFGFGKYDQEYFDQQLNQGIRIRRDEHSDSHSNDQDQNRSQNNSQNQNKSCFLIVFVVCIWISICNFCKAIKDQISDLFP